jgi:hypothetical protein
MREIGRLDESKETQSHLGVTATQLAYQSNGKFFRVYATREPFMFLSYHTYCNLYNCRKEVSNKWEVGRNFAV